MSSVCRRNGLREMTAQGHWASEGWDSNPCLCLFCDPPGGGGRQCGQWGYFCVPLPELHPRSPCRGCSIITQV